MRFELTKDFLLTVRNKIAEQDESWLVSNVLDMHYADVAEVLDKLTNDKRNTFIF